MDDKAIIDLYWKRSEQALAETDAKYGGLCYSLSYNVLANREDAQECVNDTYLAAWNALPPHRPSVLTAFLCKITRRLSINRYHANRAAKRGGGQVMLALEELADCVAPGPGVEEAAISREAYASLNAFLDRLPETERLVFVRRYFLMDPVAQIGRSFGFTEAKTTTMLHRTRKKLREHLSREGYL